MALFHLEWAVCQHGYRWKLNEAEEPQHQRKSRIPYDRNRAISLDLSKSREVVLIPNSRCYSSTTPLRIDALYRRLAECPRTIEGALRFVTAHGFLGNAKAKEEVFCELPADTKAPATDKPIKAAPNPDGFGTFLQRVADMQSLLDLIDRGDWDSIETGLWRSSEKGRPTSGGVGNLGLLLARDDSDGPELRFAPKSLFSGLYVQAIADATLGRRYRKCKNPACENYFQIGRSSGGRREGSEYCSPKCQKAHSYAKRKGSDR